MSREWWRREGAESGCPHTPRPEARRAEQRRQRRRERDGVEAPVARRS
ncbi:hypothetical protein STTU_2119 [Streptomyces sp. Tu6071]|nr:hypothetical protein STTU_2119 [Streptomyces sp. Tu6071]